MKLEKYLTEGNEMALAGLSMELKRIGLELADVESKAKAKKYIKELEGLVKLAKKLHGV